MMALLSLRQTMSFAPAAASSVSHNATGLSSTVSAAPSAKGLPESASGKDAGPHSWHTTRAVNLALQQTSFWSCALFTSERQHPAQNRHPLHPFTGCDMTDPGEDALRCHLLRACPVWRRTSEAGSLRLSRCCATMISCQVQRELQHSFCSHVRPDQML